MTDCTCPPDLVDIKQFAPLVLERFPHAPRAQIETHVREAAIEFCQKTKWLERDAVIHTHGARDFPIIVSDDEVVVNVTQVLLDGIPLVKSRDNNPLRARNDCHGSAGLRGVYWVEALETPDASVHFVPGYDTHCDAILTVRYSIAPSESACKLDRRLLTEAKRVITNGALMYLLDDNKSMLYERRFREGINSFRARRLSGRTGSHGYFTPIDTGV